MLDADETAAKEDFIDLTEEDEVMDEEVEEKDERKDAAEDNRYSILHRLSTIWKLVKDVDTTGIKLIPDGTRAPMSVC